jgi:hypothetical protein
MASKKKATKKKMKKATHLTHTKPLSLSYKCESA